MFFLITYILMGKQTSISKLLTMYHSTIVLLDGDETVYVQGSLAVSPFNTSTLGDTVTVTAPLQTEDKNTHRQRKMWEEIWEMCSVQVLMTYTI